MAHILNRARGRGGEGAEGRGGEGGGTGTQPRATSHSGETLATMYIHYTLYTESNSKNNCMHTDAPLECVKPSSHCVRRCRKFARDVKKGHVL